jgi:acyl-CoA synthetase (AMP-forming)/AMP-acid ligase II
MSFLTDWLTEPRDGQGIHLATDDGGWEYLPYAELAAGARRTAARLREAGVRSGDVVCMLMPTGFPNLATFFGIWVAGATPCPVVPPSFQARADYIAHVATVLRKAEPVLVAACGGFEELVGEAMKAAGRSDQPWEYETGTAELEPQRPGELGLLQFTSGSTGRPRGAQASWENLRSNVAMIHEVLDLHDGDTMASWLPLHHDMGLIGCLLTTVAIQRDLWLMRPEQFIRRPLQWLGSLTAGKATHCVSPSFGFAFLARRLTAEQFEGLDLSQWRAAAVGAEAIDPAALSGFARLARPAGFSIRAFRPAYGLAEATLCVSMAARPGEASLVRPDFGSLRFGEPVRILDTAPELTEEPLPAGSGWLVGHGRPAPGLGVGVRILGENGETLPDGSLGEITVTGTGVTGGYRGGGTGGSTRFVDGELRTGDAGFLLGRDLFVLGRMGDSLKVNGSSVYVEDLDLKVAAATGLERSKVAVVSTHATGDGGVALFVEAAPDPQWIEPACEVLRGRLGPDFPIKVVTGSRGLIKKTTSGKPRRRHMWQLLQAGELPRAKVVVDSVNA